MITKEIIDGEEVFAVDGIPHQRCDKCMFETLFCGPVPCTPAQRDDDRTVYFQPVHDLKTLAAYHVQEATDDHERIYQR